MIFNSFVYYMFTFQVMYCPKYITLEQFFFTQKKIKFFMCIIGIRVLSLARPWAS